MHGHTAHRLTGSAAVNTTNTNPRGGAPVPPGRCTAVPSAGRAHRLEDAILAEFREFGIEATTAGVSDGPCRWWPGDRSPAPPQPITVSGSGDEAVVVVLGRTPLEFLFGTAGGGRAGLPLLLRTARARSFENRVCEKVTAAAMAVEARRLLIVCDATRTGPAERPRAIRWVREMAHRIGYESSINGLQDLATSYLVLVAATESADAARSVLDWYRGVEER